jgi:hypothetical protein
VRPAGLQREAERRYVAEAASRPRTVAYLFANANSWLRLLMNSVLPTATGLE